MATYTELFNLKSNSDIKNKVSIAVSKKAQTLLDGVAPTTDQVAWASNALSNPDNQSEKVLLYVLAANSTSSVAAITGASDATIQTNVNAAVDALVAGGVTN